MGRIIRKGSISIHASAKEATLHEGSSAVSCFHFNPRLREGGDAVETADPTIKKISIHASAKEATWISSFLYPVPRRISIHASAKEATEYQIIKSTNLDISIHASAKEATI